MKPIPETYRGSSSGTKKRQKKVIDILIKGGGIYDIVDIPDGVTIRVFDLDIQGFDKETNAIVRNPYGTEDFETEAKLEYWE